MNKFLAYIRKSGYRLRLLFVFIVVIAIAGLSAVIINYNISRINRQLHERLHNALKVAAITLPPAMWQFNYDYLENFMTAMFLEDVIANIEILSYNKIIKTHSRADFGGQPFSFFEQSTNFIAEASDIMYNNEKIGAVRIAVSREGIYKQLIFNILAAFVLMCFVIGAVVFYYNRLIRLEKNRQAAEASNRAKSRFLANMSHELRTPLNAILGFTQLMLRNRHKDSEDSEHLKIVLKSGEHLLTLINQVLDLSKIEAGRMTLNEQSFDIYRMLDDLEDMFRLRTKERRLQLVFERDAQIPRYIVSDEVRLRQVLINLLNNAIKFTEKGGVALRAIYSNEGFLHFEIEDTGSGLDEKEVQMLFDAFFQTGKQSGEGTGLGLVISRQFVRLMHGDMTVSSRKGKGSVFGFHIRVSEGSPVECKNEESLRRVIALEPDQPKYKILITDDKPDNRRLLSELLLPFGFDVREAENGQQAIEVWESWEPHLIWMDMRMPVMDGYDATRKIKNSGKGKSTSVIALTASAFEEERQKILSVGCDDFVRKPFRESEIFDMMEKHIGVRFVYEEYETVCHTHREQPELSSEAFASVPPKLLSELEDAAVRADMNRMEEIIEEIGRFDKKMSDFLKSMADEFEYGKILNMIRKSLII